MINETLNHINLAINRALLNIGFAQHGIITSVNPSNYSVKVLLQPEQVETGFIPFAVPFYGWSALPTGGEQVAVVFQDGSRNTPIGAFLLYWNNGRQAFASSPGDTGAGEILLKHSSGSYIKLSNDGKVKINGHVEMDVTTPILSITATNQVSVTAASTVTVQSPTINLNGDVVISGTLTANNGTISMTGGNFTTSQDVVAGTVSLKSHVHSGVTVGSANTGAPV